MSDNKETPPTRDPTLEEFTASLDKVLAERVAFLVDEYLKKSEKMENDLKERHQEGSRSCIDLSIWDFTGQSMYYTLHQVRH